MNGRLQVASSEKVGRLMHKQDMDTIHQHKKEEQKADKQILLGII